LKLCFRCRKFH